MAENVTARDECMETTEPTCPQHREVRIDKAENGFIVKVGCCRFVSDNWEKVCTGLAEYWENPKEAEKKYTSHK